MIEKPKLYTTKETAAILGVSERSVKAYASAGKLQGQKFGVGWQFTQDAINRFISGERKPEASDALSAFVPGLASGLRDLRALLKRRNHEDPEAVEALDEILQTYVAPMELITRQSR